VFSETGLPADRVFGSSEGHHGVVIRRPGLALSAKSFSKLLYGTRSIEAAKHTVCHYGLVCYSHHIQPVVDKPFLPYVEVKI
jgi:hypothetical protein